MDSPKTLRFPLPRGVGWLAKITALLALVLIWVGAAVTSADVGLSVPDWPSSFGYANPPGWLHIPAIRLEHGHRKIAQLVGLCVLGLFAAVWFRKYPEKFRAVDWLPLALLAILIGIDTASIPNEFFQWIAPEQFETAFKHTSRLGGIGVAVWLVVSIVKRDAAKLELAALVLLLTACLICALNAHTMPLLFAPLILLLAAAVGWLVHGIRKRQWPPDLWLAGAALLMVSLQAFLGGLRVTKMSNAFAVAHGCLAQVFFCLLILLAFRYGKTWRMPRPWMHEINRRVLLRVSAVTVGFVFVQLTLGATMRHTHRIHVAATDILTTGGHLVPPWTAGHLLVLFLHKIWGVLTAMCILYLCANLMARARKTAGLGLLAPLLLLMTGLQITLGVMTVWTDKDFWFTNFHVFNGLAVLAISFIIAIKVWRCGPHLGLLAVEEDGKVTA